MADFKPVVIVEEIHKAAPLLDRKRGRILKAIKPRMVKVAMKTFAFSMARDEKPLIQFDTSFLQLGSEGLLVTDRAVYSSCMPAAIPLANCELVEPVSGTKGGVKVNGQVVYHYELAVGWHMECLRELAQGARDCQLGWPVAAERVEQLRQMANDKYISEAMQCISDSRDIKSTLTTAGMTERAAAETAELLPRFMGVAPLKRLPLFLIGLICLAGCILYMVNRQELPTDGILPSIIGLGTIVGFGAFSFHHGRLFVRALRGSGPEKAAKRWREFCEWQLPESMRSHVRSPRTSLAPEPAPRPVSISTLSAHSPAKLQIGWVATPISVAMAIGVWLWPDVETGTRIVISAAALVSVVVSFLWTRGVYTLLKNGLAVRAAVTAKGSPGKFQVSHLCEVRYRYEASGSSHDGIHTFEADPGLEPGDEVWVLVDPNDPKASLMCSRG